MLFHFSSNGGASKVIRGDGLSALRVIFYVPVGMLSDSWGETRVSFFGHQMGF